MHCSCLLVSSLSHTRSPSQPSRLFLLEIETHRTEGEIRKFGCLWVVSWFSVSCPAGVDRHFFRQNHNNSPLKKFYYFFFNLHNIKIYRLNLLYKNASQMFQYFHENKPDSVHNIETKTIRN